LSISTEAAQKRGGYGAERYENLEMQKRVRQLFEEFREKYESEESWKVIDGGQEVEVVSTNISSYIDECLLKVSRCDGSKSIARFGI
jgi:dTMP kinase